MRIFVLVLLFVSLGAYGQFKPTYSMTMDSATAAQHLDRHWRKYPEYLLTNFRTLSQAEVDTLNKYLPEIYRTRIYYKGYSSLFVQQGGDSLQYAGFEYYGVMIGKRKGIYVNAFPLSDVPGYEDKYVASGVYRFYSHTERLKYWGAVFNLETKRFTRISFDESEY